MILDLFIKILTLYMHICMPLTGLCCKLTHYTVSMVVNKIGLTGSCIRMFILMNNSNGHAWVYSCSELTKVISEVAITTYIDILQGSLLVYWDHFYFS